MNKKINQKLVSAYAKLIKKNAERITVSLLCEKANVARATFYTHYKDLNDFKNQLDKYIVDLLFKQATTFLCRSEKELERSVKKVNLLFNDNEITVLRNMISGTNYIDFAEFANSYFSDNKNKAPFPESMWKENKRLLDIFTWGYFPILIVNLLNYDEDNLISDIKNSRELLRHLFGESPTTDNFN